MRGAAASVTTPAASRLPGAMTNGRHIRLKLHIATAVLPPRKQAQATGVVTPLLGEGFAIPARPGPSPNAGPSRLRVALAWGRREQREEMEASFPEPRGVGLGRVGGKRPRPATPG